MARTILTVTTLLAALLAAVYQLFFKHNLTLFGLGRVVEPIGNKGCLITVPELQACEKIVLHQPTGVLYLACSTPSSRTHWTPAVDRLNSTGRSVNDYVATYNPKTSLVTRLKFVDYDSPRGLSLLGMDVVPSSSNPDELFVYLVNQRVPLGEKRAVEVGSDPSIEIFKTTLGSRTLTHVKTVEDPKIIITPNDVSGAPDGKSFHFTNSNGEKVGLVRALDFFGRASSSVGFCHVDEGCKFAISHLRTSNGIVRSKWNDTFYVSSLYGHLNVLEKQSDNTLVLTDVIAIDRGMDNLSIDDRGAVWGAGYTDALKFVTKHLADPSIAVPSSAIRITINTGPDSFYGEKYKVDKVFEDDGGLASASTTAIYDSERKRLFMHGIAASHLTVCNL